MRKCFASLVSFLYIVVRIMVSDKVSDMIRSRERIRFRVSIRIYTVSQKVGHFYFYDNFRKRGPFFTIFTVKFKKDL